MVDWGARTREIAQKFGLDPDLFWRQIKQESNFDPAAYNSRSGATGIAQIVPRWHPTVNAKDPEASLQYAANWVRSLTESYAKAGKSNPTAYALVAYNAGPGRAAQWDGTRAGLMRLIPDGETAKYLDAILGPQWAGGGSPSPIPGLPSERPSWWPSGWDWPPLSGSWPTLPSLPGADDLAGLIWDTVNGIRTRIRETIMSKAKESAAYFGGPVAFWAVGLARVFFGLLGLALTAVRVADRPLQTARKGLALVTPQGRMGKAAGAGAAAAGAIL